jgi:hypothetical protein
VTAPRAVALSNKQLALLQRAAASLPVGERDHFLQSVAAHLTGAPTDDAVIAACLPILLVGALGLLKLATATAAASSAAAPEARVVTCLVVNRTSASTRAWSIRLAVLHKDPLVGFFAILLEVDRRTRADAPLAT